MVLTTVTCSKTSLARIGITEGLEELWEDALPKYLPMSQPELLLALQSKLSHSKCLL